jgi:hypothetical protein
LGGGQQHGGGGQQHGGGGQQQGGGGQQSSSRSALFMPCWPTKPAQSWGSFCLCRCCCCICCFLAAVSASRTLAIVMRRMSSSTP